jgi:hypothetical protein
MKYKVFALLVILCLITVGCEDMIREIVKAVKIQKEAEMFGKFPPCPKERPYRIGGPVFGPCVDEGTLSEYIDLKLKGSSSDTEKDFILFTKATLFGQQMNCPKEKPYYINTFLFFGKCITKAELQEKIKGEISQWEQQEQQQGKKRFIAGSSFCKEGMLYDSHNEVCIDPSSCSTYPNTIFNSKTGNCDCKEGYVMAEEGCSPEITNRECEYDNECGTPSCSGYNKIMPRCDTRTYKCWSETVNCREYFGDKATCVSGQCKA